MIRNIADILKRFLDEEVKKLSEFNIKHAPTIGSMYEGLTTKILEMSIPEQLKLKVTNGFIHDGYDNLTGQIDCMLVKGDGTQIPYTKSYKWHVKDVLVVFEVKKNLYSKDIIDSFKHLKEVSSLYSRYLIEGDKSKEKDIEEEIDISFVYKTFSQLTGKYAPSYFKRKSLSPDLQLIYENLIFEQLSPIRIIVGYEGLKTEYSLRESLIKFLENEVIGFQLGILSFPHIITCNGYSLVHVTIKKGRKLCGNREVSWGNILGVLDQAFCKNFQS